MHAALEYICRQCHGLHKKRNNLQQNLDELQKSMGINYVTTLKKVGLVFQLKKSCKMGLTAYTTSTVRGICSFAVFYSVFRPFCRFILVYEGHFMLCYKEKSDRAMAKVTGLHDFRCIHLHNTSIICHVCKCIVLAHSIARCVFKSPGICF